LIISKAKVTSLPTRKYDTVVAVTAAIKRGTIDPMVRSSMSTSSVNTKPAMGAEKIEAIAAADPHPNSRVMVL